MKLITLNLWGGIVYEPLIEFIKKHSSDTDIFCFQEMLFGDKPEFTTLDKGRVNLFSEISSVLIDFNPYKNISNSDHFQKEKVAFKGGQAIFVRKNINVKDNGGFVCYDKVPEKTTEGGKLTGNLQWIAIELEKGELTITNLHGLWQKGTSKVDTPDRFVQSEKIKNFMDNRDGKKILCGDFNLIPTGQSIEMLEVGMKNLVKEYNVQSTRSDFYDGVQKFADYILTSPEIEVKSFGVLQDQVSDHLPLSLEFDLSI
jgi:exonuclease III